MIYITGDTHGDFTRFNATVFPKQRQMCKEDYVIVCGDFGIWNRSRQQAYWLDWLNSKPFTTLFVDGNHENHDILDANPVCNWNGGAVHFIRDSVVHLMRGQVFLLCGKRFFTMGGAASHDISAGILSRDDPGFRKKKRKMDRVGALYRIENETWWRREMPGEDEYRLALHNLEATGWSVDYIVTHCCPTSIADYLGQGAYEPDRLTDFFEELKETCTFRYWLFGHYHDNEIIDDRFVLLYERIIELR